ncbi:subunit 6 of mediator of RNA polymerase II transcription [Hamiltosporidium magnivora]|uniref:Mediator of RNA polymerase II transcription subunit 6 n=1 Tax=Hamiltosporidium magnivora TaxID=148818 RepID=A0A4Q9LIA7_9MICR|nr:subunit 6 of mediator of RNA polymerase II transcription [Hamiltosporidium magnivora]
MDSNEHISFRDNYWLNTNTLTPETVLTYFSNSQFYDKSCNNEILKMQTQYNNLIDLKLKLNEMKGIQYIVDHTDTNNTLFVIQKIKRYSSNDIELLNIYYIIHGNIYQSPTNIGIFKSRMCNMFFYLSEALDMYLDRRIYNPFKGSSIGKINTLEIHESEIEEENEEVKFLYKIFNDFKNIEKY